MRDLIVNFVIAGLGLALGLFGVACWWLNDRIHNRTDRALRRRFDQPTRDEGTPDAQDR